MGIGPIVQEGWPSAERLATGRAFPSERASVARARQWTADTLSIWGLAPHSRPSDDIVLCVSELVSNAVQHAHSAPVVELRPDDATILLMVTDQRPDLRPVIAARPEDTGRGLRVLGDLADSWGVGYSAVEQHSKTVWCQFAMPAGPVA